MVLGPRGPQHLIVLILMAVAMLPILLRTGHQRTLDLSYEDNTLNPGCESLCGPPPGMNPEPFILTFCGLHCLGPGFSPPGPPACVRPQG